MKSKQEQFAELGQRLEVEYDEQALEQLGEGVERRLEAHHRRRKVAMAGAAVVTAVAIIIGAWLKLPEPAPPAEVADQRAPATKVEPAPAATVAVGDVSVDSPLRFADGSRALPLREDSKLEVLELSESTIRVGLEQGAGRFDVTPNRRRRFEVEAGSLTVVVLGTSFDVAYEGESTVVVRVRRGLVRVDLGEQSRELRAGEEHRFELSLAIKVLPKLEPPREVEPEPSERRRPPAKAKATPSWRERARSGAFKEAASALKGGAKVRDDAGELMLAADAMRLAGHPKQALGYLDRVITKHRRDARQPLALFTKGRIVLRRGSPGRAARIFAKVAEMDLSSSLPEDALAREVEAWNKAGQRDRAASRAKVYLRRYPRGNRAASVRRHGGL